MLASGGLLLLDGDAQAVVILRGYRAVRASFGLNRIHLGAHLHLIREHKLWKGVAESWEEFLASENLNPNAARQYMNVAKKFVYEMDLDDELLAKLSTAGISALEKAGRVINDGNKEDILAALMSLSERDAIQRIIEISSAALKVLREYHDLPPDLQQEFRSRLHANEAARTHRKAQAEGHSPSHQFAAEASDTRSEQTKSKGLGFRRGRLPAPDGGDH